MSSCLNIYFIPNKFYLFYRTKPKNIEINTKEIGLKRKMLTKVFSGWIYFRRGAVHVTGELGEYIVFYNYVLDHDAE